MQLDYYKILGISHSADLEEIKQAAQTKSDDIKTALSFAFLTHAGAQVRLNEIEEAYENLSKPETRATYDSQWQPVKPSTPVAPSLPKRENVVVEPKLVSPPDRDKFQVSPHRSSNRPPPDYYKILGSPAKLMEVLTFNELPRFKVS